MPETNCGGECSWRWVQNDYISHWNFVTENTSCNLSSCLCTPPEITGEFDGQIVFTPCQQPVSRNNINQIFENYARRIENI